MIWPTFDYRIMGVPRSFMSIRPTLFFFLCWFACTAMAQQISVPKPRSVDIIGDGDGRTGRRCSRGYGGSGRRGRERAAEGHYEPKRFFSFSAVQPGVSYHVTIHANGFADWTSPAIQITPGQYRDLGSIRLDDLRGGNDGDRGSSSGGDCDRAGSCRGEAACSGLYSGVLCGSDHPDPCR